MAQLPKTFIVEGIEYTSVKLAKELNCATSTALIRLKNFKTLKEVREPIRPKGGFKDKWYTIEGVTLRTSDLMKKLNCSRETARNRIYKSKTLKDLYRPVKVKPIPLTERPKVISPEDIEKEKMNRLLFGKW